MDNIKQNTTIEQLSKRPLGKEHRTGGFRLTLKRARNTKEFGTKYLQEVLFMDDTGEIPGEILLPKYNPIQSGYTINIVICWLQEGEKGPKLYVEQWTQDSWSADGYEASRTMNYDSFSPEEEFIIRGKVRHGVVCAMIKTGQITKGEAPINDAKVKDCVNRWVDFIMTGK